MADLHDPETDRRIVTKLPLLMIDDEADHASVDTGEQVVDEDGRPDQDHQPTAINRLVRRILHSFAQSAYVGYTATPFANIFIHERGSTKQEGPDLFPAAFIVNLAAPSDYVGSAKIFGDRDENATPLALVRTIDDHAGADDSGWMPLRHKNGHTPRYLGEDALPPSLEEAIDAFVLACAARRARGQAGQHSSMLIHVTRYTSVQNEVHRQVESRVRRLRQRLTRGIGVERTIASLKSLWEKDFERVTRRAIELDQDSVPARGSRWDAVEPLLPDVVSDILVKTINGTAKDALDYTEHEKTGVTVIAIGGDKLSRGLTLEGLCVSYFLRASRMYDTLMQMGRWFGYRPGYVDLCRLYTTAELTEWFGHITDAADELREEFDQMAARGGTPRDYGLKVQSHPVLMVTSRLKMRTARSLMLSFSGTLGETVALYRTGQELERNLTASRELVAVLGDPEVDPQRRRAGQSARWKGFVWNDVPASHVLDFLSEYRTHPLAHRVDSALLSEFIRKMLPHGELTRWTVALIGGGTGRHIHLRNDIKVAMLKRKVKGGHLDNRYSIGRLMSPRDEAIDLGDAEWNAALRRSIDRTGREGRPRPKAPSGPDVRHVRGFGAPGVPGRPDRGLLFLYMLDPGLADAGFRRTRRQSPPSRSVFRTATAARRSSTRSTTCCGNSGSRSMGPPTDEALDVAWRALNEAGEDHPTEGWRTIPVERTAQCRILAGRRFRSGDEAVLFGFPLTAAAAGGNLPRARGFHVEMVRENIPGDALAWIALVRQPAGDPTMFARMSSDIIALLRDASADDMPLFRLFTARIRAWQAFMESGRDDMLGPAAEVGLVGELRFLRQILEAGVAASVAVDGWRGPVDGLHDFVLGAGAVEVKASTTSGEFPANVGSLDQLDDSLVRPLFLAGVRLALRTSGRTLPEIVADVDACLSDDPVARARFSDLVLRAGVLGGVQDRYVRRFAAVRMMLFRVTDAFPRLTRRNVAQAVRRARYDLDLDLVHVPETDLDGMLRELQVI